jgi:protein-tyrosine phosphatase
MKNKKKWLSCVALTLAMTTLSGCSMLNAFLSNNGNNSTSDERYSNMSEENEMLNITAPSGIVYPYLPAIKRYIEAGATANVSTYGGAQNQYRGVKIAWECKADNVAKYVVEYGTKADYSDAISETCDETSIEVFNLYKATTYYIRVTAYAANGEVLARDEGRMETTDVGPRFMKIDGLYNVRDLGGYKTSDGKTTVQGLLYRGGSLTTADIYPHSLTDSGKVYMCDVLGIKTEIDFRTAAEAGGHTESPIPGANLAYITLGGYADAFGGFKGGYRDAFLTLADKNNYPVYMHCTGGADRTGTVAFLLNALLGVSELECIQDYELTTFSIYNTRDTKQGTYAGYYQKFREKLDAFDGDTLQKKVESYLLSIGLSKMDIANIKAIMYGEL